MTRPDLTIAICTRNRPVDLERTLLSIRWQDEPPKQILVIDDSDVERRTETAEVCGRVGGPIEIETKDTPGLTLSRNLAIELSTGEVTLYLDDDVVLRPDYVRLILDAFDADRNLVGAGGSIDDDHVYGWQRLRSLLMIPGRPNGRVYRSGWSSQTPRRVTKDVEHLIGCNMAYRTDVLKRYRFNDEFRGYALGEDLEFSHRLHLDGHRLTCLGDAHIWHITASPRHDENWGYREVAIRPIVGRRRFNRAAFVVSALTFAGVNAVRNRERARGNMTAIRDVLRKRADQSAQAESKNDPLASEGAHDDDQ